MAGDESGLGEGISARGASYGRGMVWMVREEGTRHPSGAVRSHVDYRKERGIPRECDSEESTDKGRVGDITGLGYKGLNIGSRVRAQHECSCESQFGRRGDCCVCIKEKEHPHSEGLPGRCVCS